MEITSSYIYIPVSDIQRSAEWYKENLGLMIVKEDERCLELRSASGARVILFHHEQNRASHIQVSTEKQAAYGFVVDNIMDTYIDLMTKEIEVSDIKKSEGLSFTFYDLDRNIIEISGNYPRNTGWTIFERLKD